MAVTTFSPDANPESTTVDGYTHDNGTSLSWSNLRNAAGATANDSDATIHALVIGGGAGPVWKGLRRAYLLFNVSIPGGVTVTSAKIRLYVTIAYTALGDLSTVVVAPSPASNTALATGDHAIANWDFAAPHSNTVATSTLNADTYNDWTLDASGLALLTNGVVKLGLVLENDRANSAPGVSTDNQNSGIVFASADSANPPILEITHTDPPSSGASYAFFMSFIGGLLLLGKQFVRGGGPLTLGHVLRRERVITIQAC